MLNMITDKVYYMPQEEKTDRPALGLICGNKYSLIVDAGTSPKHAREFLSIVRGMNTAPPRYVAITHFHQDHVFGIATMNLPTIAHYKTKDKIKEMQELAWDDQSLAERVKLGLESQFTFDCIREEIPNRSELIIENAEIVFDNRIEVNLDGVTCIIENIGGPHTEDSCLVYVPEEKVLFMGDCIYGRKHNGVYGYIKSDIVAMVAKIKKYDAEHYLVSHMELQSKDEMMRYLDELISIGELVGDDTSLENAIIRYTEKFNKAPDEEAVFNIGCFASVNAV